jgi:hypothetical protein
LLIAVVEDERLDARVARPVQPGGSRPVRDDDRDAGVECAAVHGVDERLKVAAPP